MSIWTSWVTRTRIGPRGGKGFPWQHCLAITPTTEITNEWLALSNKIHLLDWNLAFIPCSWMGISHSYFQMVQFSCSVMSDSLRPHGLQHARLPCPSPEAVRQVGDAIQPSCPLSPFCSCLQSFPASGSFLMSQFFASGGQRIGASGCCFSKLYSFCFYLTFPPYLRKLIALSNFLLST